MKKLFRILLIIDPQNDFITGNLAVSGAYEKIKALSNSDLSKYDYIGVTLDSHPSNHCSFKENGGIWPNHCIVHTNGWDIPLYLEQALKNSNVQLGYYHKGADPNQEEYSIFDSENGYLLENQILDIFINNNGYVQIDICGIAGDYCVLETHKGLRKFIGDDCITVLTEYTASIDGGDTLMNYIETNDLNYDINR